MYVEKSEKTRIFMENKKPKINKKTLGMIALFVFCGVIILITALNEFSGGENAARLQDVHIDWLYLLPAAGCWLFAVCAEVVKYGAMMRKKCGYVDVKLITKTVLLGRYYDNITPSGIGGQPFQIYYMRKGGLSVADSAAIPLLAFVSMQFAFVILGLVCFILGGGIVHIAIVKVASYAGLIFYAFIPVVIVLFAFFENGMLRLIRWIIKVLAKLRIVKNPEETEASWTQSIGEYAVAVREIIHNKFLCIKIMIYAICYQTGILSIPFFVIRAFGGKVDFIGCFITTISIYAAITFIPTPGNAGAAEGSFYAVFASLTSGYIFWAMMTWRFFVFYLFIIIGAGIYLYEGIRSRRSKSAASGEKLSIKGALKETRKSDLNEMEKIDSK